MMKVKKDLGVLSLDKMTNNLLKIELEIIFIKLISSNLWQIQTREKTNF